MAINKVIFTYDLAYNVDNDDDGVDDVISLDFMILDKFTE